MPITGLQRLALLRGGITAAMELLDTTPPPSGPTNGLQLESGDFLLAEDGRYLVQE